MPIKDKWAEGKYLAACANHWTPQEIPMSLGIVLWENPHGLADEEHRIINLNELVQYYQLLLAILSQVRRK